MQLELEIETLKEVKEELNKGIFQHEKVVEVLESIRNTSIRYSINYTTGNVEHFTTYQNHAKRYKNMVLVELAELIQEMKQAKPNVKRCNALLNRLIGTRLYMKNILKFISKWKSKINVTYRKEPILI